MRNPDQRVPGRGRAPATLLFGLLLTSATGCAIMPAAADPSLQLQSFIAQFARNALAALLL